MNTRLITASLCAAFCIAAAAQTFPMPVTDWDPRESCTSIMVGRKATTDGSVITCHTCDGGYRSSVYVQPPCDYAPDTVMTVYTGRMFTDYAADRSPLEAKGTMPQARHTFGYLDTAYPCVNEHQLAMGETTFGGEDTLRTDVGMFQIEELQRLALERCTTAREAVRLMGQTAEKYGYIDGGECLTVADPQEVWHFEIVGPGKGKKGAVWVAVRIPDDEVGVSANISRIAEVDTSDPSRCMASSNVRDVARRLGLWDGKEPFSFWRAYGGENWRYPDQKKSFTEREYFIFNSLAPSLHLDFEAAELPLSVKPDTLVSLQDVLALYRQYYDGHDFCPTRDLRVTVKRDSVTDTITSWRANPWMLGEDKNLMGELIGHQIGQYRPVAVAFCSYATVAQLRSWLPDDIGGVVWMSWDNPAQSPRIPVYCGVSRLPEAMTTNGNNHYRPEAAIWHFRTPNKMAALRWGKARGDFEDAIAHYEQKGISEMPWVEARYKEILEKDGRDKAREWLADYTADFLGAAMARWDELGRRLMQQGRYGL